MTTSELRRVFVGFSTPKRWNPLSWAIRCATYSRASHAWLLVDDPVFKVRLVVEAGVTGFRIESLARFEKTNEIVAIVEPAHPLEAGMPEAARWLGEKFDGIGLAGMAWVLIGRLFFNERWKNPFRSVKSLFCSEAVVRSLLEADYPTATELFRGKEEEIAPGDLLRWFERDGESVVHYGADFTNVTPADAPALYPEIHEQIPWPLAGRRRSRGPLIAEP
ncbi:MAG TPA: hypothetical protein VLT61_03990 [Anaeromyxobacteraceae bacterium]|nr:hypothetical protein [Anaeromyxobacteraceae bacterium]